MDADRPVLPIRRVRPEDPDERVRVFGWVVRSENDDRSDAYFPDATYGGRHEAYRAARAWYITAGKEDASDATNIDRIERESEAAGFRVRIQRQHATHTKYFSDALLGGAAGALRAAQYWRDLKKGDTPRGADHPAPDELILDEEADRYGRAAIERSQFGVPRLSVELRVLESGNPIPYLKASWPVSGNRSRDRYISLEREEVEAATRAMCQELVDARRISDLTPEDLGNRATPFDVLDGWFASQDRPAEEEADELYQAVVSDVQRRARDVLQEWRCRKKGIPGLQVRVRKNEEGRYAPWLRVRWNDPSGERQVADEEIIGDDVEGALRRLAANLVQYYQDHPEKPNLRHERRSPFSVFEAAEGESDSSVEQLVEVGLTNAILQYRNLRQGRTGLRLAKKEVDPDDVESKRRGRPSKPFTVYLTWPTRSSVARRQKSFDRITELQGALETVVRRALNTIRQGDPVDQNAALGSGSPFEGVDLQHVQDESGRERVTRRIVRQELPSLRLEYEALASD